MIVCEITSLKLINSPCGMRYFYGFVIGHVQEGATCHHQSVVDKLSNYTATMKAVLVLYGTYI